MEKVYKKNTEKFYLYTSKKRIQNEVITMHIQTKQYKNKQKGANYLQVRKLKQRSLSTTKRLCAWAGAFKAR